MQAIGSSYILMRMWSAFTWNAFVELLPATACSSTGRSLIICLQDAMRTFIRQTDSPSIRKCLANISALCFAARGAASTEFDKLCKVWSHASVPIAKNIRIYEACVVSKLMYCLEGLW